MQRPLGFFLTLSLACRPPAADSGDSGSGPSPDAGDSARDSAATDTGAPEDSGDSGDSGGFDASTIRVSVDAAIQRGGWGAGLGRCQVQVGFFIPPDDDGMYQNPGQPWEPLALPGTPGACAATIRDPDEMRAALEDAEDHPDNWQVETALDVGAEVHLVSASRTIVLPRALSPEGVLRRYEMPDCGPDTFPFGEVFDLVVPEGGPEIGPFTVAGALAVGEAVSLVQLGPDPALPAEQVAANTPLDLVWSYAGPPPALAEGLRHFAWVTARNDETGPGGMPEFEALVCLAEEADQSPPTAFSIDPADLGALTTFEDTAGGSALRLQIDARTEGPEIHLPWGQRARIQSTVSIDGSATLHAGG